MIDDMDEFTLAYFEAALWSSIDESGEPLDANYTIEDFAPETRNQMINDARSFQRMNDTLIEIDDSAQIQKEGRWALAGHDFWLTRNGHGTGFWGGSWPKSGDALTKAAKGFGEYDLYVGDDGLIYGSGGLPGLNEAPKSDRLFIGIYPTGIVYADKSREEHGDYARCAFLSFATLTLHFEPGCTGDLKAEIEKDAAAIQARRGEEFQIDASGRTVTLGYAIGKASERSRRPKAPRVRLNRGR